MLTSKQILYCIVFWPVCTIRKNLPTLHHVIKQFNFSINLILLITFLSDLHKNIVKGAKRKRKMTKKKKEPIKSRTGIQTSEKYLLHEVTHFKNSFKQ